MCARWYNAKVDKESPCHVHDRFGDVDRDVKRPENKDICYTSVSDPSLDVVQSWEWWNVLATTKAMSVTIDLHWRISLVSTPAIVCVCYFLWFGKKKVADSLELN